jgi:pyridine nucleotide-disulfide oxidoreductase
MPPKDTADAPSEAIDRTPDEAMTGSQAWAAAEANRPEPPSRRRPRVVIVGGGFGGRAAARALDGADVDVLLLDARNHHCFQPLLYQAATAALDMSDIA